MEKLIVDDLTAIQKAFLISEFEGWSLIEGEFEVKRWGIAVNSLKPC